MIPGVFCGDYGVKLMLEACLGYVFILGFVFGQAKFTLGDDTRTVPLSAGITYAELLDVVKAKFPNAGPVLLKYQDK